MVNTKVLIEHIEYSIDQANKEKSKLTPEILSIEGMSSRKNRHLLNNILSLTHLDYLEIGVWKGSTLISALWENKPKSVTVIENWSEFSGPKDAFNNNIRKYLPKHHILLYEMDCFDFNPSNFPGLIDVYFYDGNHDQQNQYKALTHFYQGFDDQFVLIVDDFMHSWVQQGTYDAIKDLGLKTEFEKVLSPRWNNDPETWWGGLYIGVLKK